MSWYVKREKKCINCGYEDTEDVSTITISRHTSSECPKCGGEFTSIIIGSGNDFFETLKKCLANKNS